MVASKKSEPASPSVATRQAAPSVFSSWTVAQVRATLNAHEYGDFSSSAILADHIRRDDRVFAALDTRTLAVLGLPFVVEPSTDTTNEREAKRIAKDVESWWFATFPEAVLADALRWSYLMGFAIGELTYYPHKNQLRQNLTIHHPQFVQWRESESCFYLTTLDGPVKIVPGNGRWVLFAPNGAGRPWMNGAVRALSIPFLIRTFARRDWARRSEVEGLGIRRARIPKQANPSVVDKFIRDVSALGNETSIRLPEGFDVDLLTIDTSAADGFQKLINHCDSSITLAILGQNLTTSIEGGSFAAATVHAKVQLDRIESDVAMLATTARSQIVKPWGVVNVPNFDPDTAPWPRWDTVPPEDLQKNAQALLTLSQAIPTLQSVGVDIGPLLERFRLSPVGPSIPILEYHIANGILTKNEVRARLGFGPVEGGDEPTGQNEKANIPS